MRIERVGWWETNDAQFADSAVLQAGGSDHYPVAARIVGAHKPLESKTYASKAK